MTTRRTLTYQGETLTIMEWAERFGISYFTLSQRLRFGWSVERALTEPVGRQGGKRARRHDWELEHQRKLHAARRQMTRSLRQLVGAMEKQMAELRELDADLTQIEQAYRGVGQSKFKEACDRSHHVAQETV